MKILEARRAEFERRRNFLVPALRRAGLEVPAPPSGAFYVYARVPARLARDGRRFALELLERAGVAATPGVDFGANGTQRYVRFAYTRSMADLREAARRLARLRAARPLRRRRRASAA